MGRMRVEPEEKKKTVAVQLKVKDIERLDKYIEDVRERYPFAGINRKTVMETLILHFLEKQGF